jgi:choline dehydrogenase-like flavoprotein
VVPSSTGVNPQITVMARAARGARRLADTLT